MLAMLCSSVSQLKALIEKLCFRLKVDMQDQSQNSLIDPMGECTQCLLNLVVLGRATPYLHNGDMQIEVEETGEVRMIKCEE